MGKKNRIKNFFLDENKMKIVAFVVWCLFVVSQIIITFWFDGKQANDAIDYRNFALANAEAGTWYPNPSYLHHRFFYGNGYVNLLTLIFRFTTNLKVVFILNILLTQLLLGACLFTLKKLSQGPLVRYYFIIMFCLLNTFISETVALRTEVIFTALAFLALAFLHTEKKYTYVLCGLLLGLANWIRPLGIAFLLGGIAIHLLYKRKLRHILMTVSAYVLTLVVIGTFAYVNCGYFIYQPTTFAVNFLMSANDDANGTSMDVHREGQVGYVEPEKAKDMIFKDYDEHYMKLAFDWIKEHPIEYIAKKPATLFYLYATETYSGSAYFNNEILTGGIDYIKSLAAKLLGRSDEPLLLADILVLLDQLWYMILCGLAFAGIFIKSVRKNNWLLHSYLLIMILGTGITVLVVAGARYHLPYLPVIMMYAAISFSAMLKKKKPETIEEK